MEITGITIRIVEFDASPRFGDKPIPANRPKTWKYPVVTVHTSAGIDGYSMGYGPHGDGEAMGDIIRQTYLPDIIGENPLHTERLWQKLRQKNRHLYNLSDALLGVLDVAFWDIKGKALNSSVVDLLGKYRQRIKTYATGHMYLPTDEELYNEVRQAREAGYHAFKLQLWQGVKADIPRFYAAREAAGDDFILMQDASAGYTYAEALQVGRVLDKLNYYWFEEPIPDRQLGLLRKLDGELHLPLLVGESSSLMEMTELLRYEPFGFVRGDVLIKGGITGLQKAFAMCDLFGANLEVHTAGTPLLDVANLHVACANKNCEFIELHHPIFRFGIKDSPLDKSEGGWLTVPDGPGLGVELDWNWIDNHTISCQAY